MAVSKKKRSASKKSVQSAKKNSTTVRKKVTAEKNENAIVHLQEEILYSKTEKPDDRIEVCSEKLTYASVMERGVQLAVVFLAGTLLLYISGILPASTPPEKIPHYWNLRADEFIRATGSPKGWEWLDNLHYSDNLVMAGIAGLAFLSMIGYLILADAYWRKKWYIFFSIVITEITIILLVSTGILSGGGH